MNSFVKLGPQRIAIMTLLAVFAISHCGCGSNKPTVVPVSGTVLFEGKPLVSGSVMFQPQNGRHARAIIQPDGTFVMTTYEKGDGTTVGQHMVRVTSTEKPVQDGQGEEIVGKLLIPKAYSNFRTSGITVEVPAEGTDSLVIKLEKNKR